MPGPMERRPTFHPRHVAALRRLRWAARRQVGPLLGLAKNGILMTGGVLNGPGKCLTPKHTSVHSVLSDVAHTSVPSVLSDVAHTSVHSVLSDVAHTSVPSVLSDVAHTSVHSVLSDVAHTSVHSVLSDVMWHTPQSIASSVMWPSPSGSSYHYKMKMVPLQSCRSSSGDDLVVLATCL